MIVDRGLHERCQAQVVHHINVKDVLGILALFNRPVIEQDFHSLSVPLCAGYMQGVTPVSVVEIDLDVLLQ